MKYIHGLENININADTAVTVGKFDGLHRGHELLTDRITHQKQTGLKAVVFTFSSSPKKVLEGEQTFIVTNEERRNLFEEAGVDYLIECPFTEELMHMLPESFIDLLCDKLHMKYMAVGSDFTFGYMGKGDASLLETLSVTKGFRLEVLDKLQDLSCKRDISSTYIRQEIEKGNVAKAGELLGKPYFIYGKIIHGNHIGHRLGIPTINIRPEPEKLLPPFGVYAVEVLVDGCTYRGMTNVGVKPTVGEAVPTVGIETYIFDFDRDIYGEKAKVLFLDYMRPEKKFPSFDALKEQLEKDKVNVKHWFEQK